MKFTHKLLKALLVASIVASTGCGKQMREQRSLPEGSIHQSESDQKSTGPELGLGEGLASIGELDAAVVALETELRNLTASNNASRVALERIFNEVASELNLTRQQLSRSFFESNYAYRFDKATGKRVIEHLSVVNTNTPLMESKFKQLGRLKGLAAYIRYAISKMVGASAATVANFTQITLRAAGLGGLRSVTLTAAAGAGRVATSLEMSAVSRVSAGELAAGARMIGGAALSAGLMVILENNTAQAGETRPKSECLNISYWIRSYEHLTAEVIGRISEMRGYLSGMVDRLAAQSGSPRETVVALIRNSPGNYNCVVDIAAIFAINLSNQVTDFGAAVCLYNQIKLLQIRQRAISQEITIQLQRYYKGECFLRDPNELGNPFGTTAMSCSSDAPGMCLTDTPPQSSPIDRVFINMDEKAVWFYLTSIVGMLAESQSHLIATSSRNALPFLLPSDIAMPVVDLRTVGQQFADWQAQPPPASVGTQKFYRAYSPAKNYHFYTASLPEFTNAITSLGYTDERHLSLCVFPASSTAAGLGNLYRLYNPTSNVHYYTMSASERDIIVGLGWRYEMVAAKIFVNPASGSSTIYRLYNKSSDRHLYTTDGVYAGAVVAGPGGWAIQANLGYAPAMRADGTCP